MADVFLVRYTRACGQFVRALVYDAESEARAREVVGWHYGGGEAHSVDVVRDPRHAPPHDSTIAAPRSKAS